MPKPAKTKRRKPLKKVVLLGMPNIPKGPWKHWPTHWAGGTGAYQVRGENVPWVEQESGPSVICLIDPNIRLEQKCELARVLGTSSDLLKFVLDVANNPLKKKASRRTLAKFVKRAQALAKKAGCDDILSRTFTGRTSCRDC